MANMHVWKKFVCYCFLCCSKPIVRCARIQQEPKSSVHVAHSSWEKLCYTVAHCEFGFGPTDVAVMVDCSDLMILITTHMFCYILHNNLTHIHINQPSNQHQHRSELDQFTEKSLPLVTLLSHLSSKVQPSTRT